mgnify:CR=1 FL=1
MKARTEETARPTTTVPLPIKTALLSLTLLLAGCGGSGGGSAPAALLTTPTAANSFTMDFLVRMKVNLKMALTILDSLPFPRLAAGGPVARRLVRNTLMLVCTGPEMNELWDEILDLARAEPAPLTFFDMLIHMTPMVVLRGTPEAVEYYQVLKAEVECRIARGIAAVPGEKKRFYWDGPPIWSALRPLSRTFADHGVAVVASTFCATFTFKELDPREPVESIARTYAAVFGNRSERYQRDYLADKFTRFGVDAAVFHDCRTTPEASHVRYGLAVRAERQTGVPAFVIEADSHDERLFSGDRLQRQLGEFLEQRG